MLHPEDGRHQDVHFVPVHFKCIIPKEPCYAIVGFSDFGLGILVPTDYYYSSVIRKHLLEVVTSFVQGLRPSHSNCICDEFFSFIVIVFDLYEIISIDLQGFRVVRVDSGELVPEIIDPLSVSYDSQPQLMQHIQIHHLRV